MGIHGLLRELGAPPRISLAALSAQHYIDHSRPLILAIDAAIWLFQIQSGKGGSNPALRTFYYRLLRLLSLNIWPLFVFDGPNKPLFKRNKKVGGGGNVRVATVPEFLAKQMLKEFGFPWHVAPGEAEAECALLQREGVVDAVLSEDVDTLMFGCGVTLRNWSAEGSSTKVPTHVSVYRTEETKERSRGLDREGMILVALMSGGDYLPDGIPGCGPKVACDAARAGFGKDLCALVGKKDTAGLRLWKDRLQHQIRTNEAKYFSRRNSTFTIPEAFPNMEVLGYYTHPCISTPGKVQKLREGLKWDHEIDFAALRTFTADAFDWRCLGGAQKFIKNLAPAILIRELRLRSLDGDEDGEEAQEQAECRLVTAIRGKRNHSSTDGALEYRITFVPAKLVPIDLSIEEPDDEIVPAGPGDAGADTDAESDFASLAPSSTEDGPEADSALPASPARKRQFKPFDPTQPEKLWIMRTFLQLGCPMLVEKYEASVLAPKTVPKKQRKVNATKAKGQRKGEGMPKNALLAYARVTKAVLDDEADVKEREPLKENKLQVNALQKESATRPETLPSDGFKMPSTNISADFFASLPDRRVPAATTRDISNCEVEDLSITPRPFTAFTEPSDGMKPRLTSGHSSDHQKTPTRRKRPSHELSSPATARSQRTITSYYSPSPHRRMDVVANGTPKAEIDFINLLSSSPAERPPTAQQAEMQTMILPRALTPTPPNLRSKFVRSLDISQSIVNPHERNTDDDALPAYSCGKLSPSITKRRKRRGPLRRWQTDTAVANADHTDGEGVVDVAVDDAESLFTPLTPDSRGHAIVIEAMDLASPSPARSSNFLPGGSGRGGLMSNIDRDLPSPGQLRFRDTRVEEIPTTTAATDSQVTSVYANVPHSTPASSAPPVSGPVQPLRRSPRQAQQRRKKAILLRQSLEGAWKEVEADAETLDLTGDGSGWRATGGRAEIVGLSSKVQNDGTRGLHGKMRAYRKSGVEVLDLTGA